MGLWQVVGRIAFPTMTEQGKEGRVVWKPAALVALAAWFGLLTGFIDVGFVMVKQLVIPWLPNNVISSLPLDVVWMAPLAECTFFILVGLAYTGLSIPWKRLRSLRVAVFFFAFLCFFSVLVFLPRLTHLRFYWLANFLFSTGLAFAVMRAATWRADGFPRLVGASLVPLLVALLGVALGTAGLRWWSVERALAALPPARPKAPNVLFITLDTVRAEDLSLYGYKRETTPNLDKLAQRGVVFDRAWSTSPWTLPSHASMFTGKYPDDLSTNFLMPLDRTYPTLAEVLQSRGYETCGFVANFDYCGRRTGLDRGFVYYEDYPQSVAQTLFCSSLGTKVAWALAWRQIGLGGVCRKSAADINESFLHWLDRRPQGGPPRFVFLNYYDAHSPYVVPSPFDQRFTPLTQSEKDRLIVFDQRDLEIRPGSPDMQLYQRTYDDCITYLDLQLGLLFEGLERRGLLENTLVVITSDHGEQFGEHHLVAHHNSLYRQLHQVPLLMLFPGPIPSGLRVAEPISLRSLPATVLDLLDLDDGQPLPGASLAALWQEENVRPARKDPLLATVHRSPDAIPSEPTSKGSMKSIVADGYHLIKNNGDQSIELYNFESDPGEDHDLMGDSDHRAIVEELEGLLDRELLAN